MLQAYDGTGRITRGKTYANTGRVTDIKVEGQTVTAKVAGHFEDYYHIRIAFPTLSKKTEMQVSDILAKNPVALVALHSGIMREDLIAEFEKKEVRLIPDRWIKSNAYCSCPDDGNPCKHIAAVLFILAREIDFDPRLIFQIAGFDLNKVTADGISGKTAADGIVFEAGSTAAPLNPETALTFEEPVPISIKNKKTISEILQTEENPQQLLHFPSGESYLPLITGFLPPAPIFSKSDFIIKLTEAYHTALFAYDFNFYNERSVGEYNDVFYVRAFVTSSGLAKSEDNFPLKNNTPLTMKIKFSKTNETECTLLQAGILFDKKPPVRSDYTESYACAFSFYRLAKKIIWDSAFIPAVNVHAHKLSIFWKPLTASTEINNAIDAFAALLNEDFFAPVKNWGKRYCAELLLTAYLTEYVFALNFFPKATSVQDKTVDRLFFVGDEVSTKTPGNKNLATAIYTWLAVLNYQQNEYFYRLTLKSIDNAVEKNSETLKLSASVSKADELNAPYIELPTAVKKASAANKERILKFPIVLSSYLPVMTELAVKPFITLDLDEVADFLQNASKLLQKFGVEIVLPKGLQKALTPKAVLSVKKSTAVKAVQSFFTRDSLLEYDRKIMLGDFELSVEEFKKLVNQNSKLIKFRDQYVLLNPNEVAKLFAQLDNQESLSQLDIMQAVLADEAVVSPEAQIRLDSIFRAEILPEPKKLRAQLRPYQRKGFSWMYANIKSGLGCLLADDMGLGKTLQVITLLLTLQEQGILHSETGTGVLIVCPATLLANWKHEIQKFAPSLSYDIYHGAGRKITHADVTLTTYQTMQKDIEAICDAQFCGIILDEAQAIKNTATKTSKAVKKPTPQFRIALTGTPVENSLEDMRSIFDFILPNYFGDAKTFREKWRIPIELHSNEKISEKFAKVTAPFVLRRLKTDKSIISDLPEKILTDTYCNLTPQQAAMYEALVQNELAPALEAKTQVVRTSLILKLLTGLKQVCNHPGAFDKMSEPRSELSGKTQTLCLLLKDILAGGEKVIIFSQYVQTINIIESIIQNELKTFCLKITGQMQQERRTENVKLFQTDPQYRIMLISLKAGGTGLNLTAASRVIHFDLWYNPAVEDQATDRAFRIGQTQNVFVHRFICEGTFEEKINEMIQKKRNIAESISGGETWISKLSNAELKEIITLEK